MKPEGNGRKQLSTARCWAPSQNFSTSSLTKLQKNMNIKIQITPECPTTIDGTMTFGKTDDGQIVLNFASTEENVDLQPFKATCLVQTMRNGDVYITQIAQLTPKRNPRVFDGHHITVTQRDDGSLRPNFKPLAMGPGFDIAAYATAVANELLWALTSLIEK